MSSSERDHYALNKERVAEFEQRNRRIRQLNDTLRTTFTGGRVTLTYGVRMLGVAKVASVINAIREFASFSENNDSHQEHDFGSIDIVGHRIFWRIDSYDKQLEFGSPNASDPNVTARVLTIMLAEEY